MRKLLVVLFAANLVLAAMSATMLPSRVAIHFGAGGAANGWASNPANALAMAAFQVGLFCLFRFSSRWLLRLPPGWISLPNRDYWLAEENRARLAERLDRSMAGFGAGLFAFLLVTGWLVFRANLLDPPRLNTPVFLAALGAFFVFTAWWLISFFRALRIPRER